MDNPFAALFSENSVRAGRTSEQAIEDAQQAHHHYRLMISFREKMLEQGGVSPDYQTHQSGDKVAEHAQCLEGICKPYGVKINDIITSG